MRMTSTAETLILIVEEDDDIARMLGYVLRRTGFSPLVITNCRAAAAHVASQDPPAAVLLDDALPHRGGLSLAATIRADARWSKVPILLLTGRELAGDEERVRALGISDLVPKPFHPASLVSRIRGLLGLVVH